MKGRLGIPEVQFVLSEYNNRRYILMKKKKIVRPHRVVGEVVDMLEESPNGKYENFETLRIDWENNSERYSVIGRVPRDLEEEILRKYERSKMLDCSF